MGVCGAALVPGISTPAPARAGGEGGVAIPALPGRLLGRTGITAPLISMGTAAATSVNLIRAGYDAGIKLFFAHGFQGLAMWAYAAFRLQGGDPSLQAIQLHQSALCIFP